MSKRSQFEDLYNRLTERFNSDMIDYDGDSMSAYSLIKILKSTIGKYNNVFIVQSEGLRKVLNKSINRKNRSLFDRKNIPAIHSINSIIEEDGNRYMDIDFYDSKDSRQRYMGSAVIDEDRNITIDYLRDNYSVEDTEAFLRENIESFNYYFELMKLFSLEYPNMKYSFIPSQVVNRTFSGRKEDNPENILEVDDGFLHAYIDINDLDASLITFSDIKDLDLSRTRSAKYGELYDYLDYYKEHYMNRLKVELKDLNPQFKQFVNGKKSYMLKRVK